MDVFNFFIIFPKETEKTSVADIVTDEVTYDVYLDKIRDFTDRADCEKGVELFYDASERNAFINDLILVAKLGDYYLSDPFIVINDLLRNATELTKKERKQRENCFYALWDFESRSLISENIPASVHEAFEYETSSADSKQLLLNLGSEFFPLKKEIFIFRDTSSYDNQEMPTLIKLEQVCNFRDLENWLVLNRTPRQLNTIEPRHNEKSPHYIGGRSPILYDFKRDEKARQYVQDLLNTAIFDKYSPHNPTDLVNYDADKGLYIWFEYQNENPQNEYHAYHLAKPFTHEADLIAITRIPKRAKRFVDKKNTLNY
jgi:hypothetical protein